MIIDFHAHLYPPSFKTRRDEIIRQDDTFALLFSNPKAETASAPELLQAMDESNVDVAVTLGLGWTNLKIAREANDYILDAAAASSGRLIPFCSVNPAWGQDAVTGNRTLRRQGCPRHRRTPLRHPELRHRRPPPNVPPHGCRPRSGPHSPGS